MENIILAPVGKFLHIFQAHLHIVYLKKRNIEATGLAFNFEKGLILSELYKIT